MITVEDPKILGFSSERLVRIHHVMQGYVDDHKLPGIITLIARRGEILHLNKFGWQDVSKKIAMEYDTIFRIYSMTKPITSIALMMLFEQGLFQLSDPLSRYIPEFTDAKVLGNSGVLNIANKPISIHHLLTHTAGFAYGVFAQTEVDLLYQKANLWEPDIDLTEMVHRIASLPLMYHPGERWYYSVATDVIGRLVEIFSGVSLAEFLQNEIFTPLGMEDTAFQVPADKADRFASMYGQSETSMFEEVDGADFFDVTLYSGGGGLVSTIDDYYKFATMLLNKGQFNGVRLIGRKTCEWMTMNHLSESLLPLVITETYPGIGYGLGISVVLDVTQTDMMGSVGLYGWAGMASTYFWVDPQEEIIAIVLTQYVPSNEYPLHADFRTLVYQALID